MKVCVVCDRQGWVRDEVTGEQEVCYACLNSADLDRAQLASLVQQHEALCTAEPDHHEIHMCLCALASDWAYEARRQAIEGDE